MTSPIIKKASQSDFEICRQFDEFNKDKVLKEKIEQGLVNLAWSDDNCLGYFRWDWFWNRHPYLCLIIVREDQRNQGIGYRLHNHWEDSLKEEGYKFCLSSSQKNEPHAVQWHMKQGYREIGRIGTLNEDGSDEIFLRKDLV